MQEPLSLFEWIGYSIVLLIFIIIFVLLIIKDKKLEKLEAQLGQPLRDLEPGKIYNFIPFPENLIFLIEQNSLNPKAYIFSFNPQKLPPSFIVLENGNVVPWEPINPSEGEDQDPIELTDVIE